MSVDPSSWQSLRFPQMCDKQISNQGVNTHPHWFKVQKLYKSAMRFFTPGLIDIWILATFHLFLWSISELALTHRLLSFERRIGYVTKKN